MLPLAVGIAVTSYIVALETSGYQRGKRNRERERERKRERERERERKGVRTKRSLDSS